MDRERRSAPSSMDVLTAIRRPTSRKDANRTRSRTCATSIPILLRTRPNPHNPLPAKGRQSKARLVSLLARLGSKNPPPREGSSVRHQRSTAAPAALDGQGLVGIGVQRSGWGRSSTRWPGLTATGGRPARFAAGAAHVSRKGSWIPPRTRPGPLALRCPGSPTPGVTLGELCHRYRVMTSTCWRASGAHAGRRSCTGAGP